MPETTPFSAENPTPTETRRRFAELYPALGKAAALVEADRCLFCFDAPCAQACPTHIDVPRFIKKIATGNLAGSAQAIVDANILGGSCSRACPVEVLCEGACVLHHAGRKPIEIARLQRFAMDDFHARRAAPFVPATSTGERVALIGAGPASLACTAELRRHGIATTLYDARPMPGGLNTYGIAEYKLPLAESLREIDMLTRLGVEFRLNTTVDAAALQKLAANHAAIFLGCGLGAIHRLGIAGDRLPGVTDALSVVAGLKTGAVTQMSGRVAVIGAGNTAIDAAIAAVRLGAGEVTMIYRRGRAQMSAFSFEYEHALAEGVRMLWHTQPTAILGEHAVEGLQVQALEAAEDGSLVPLGEPRSLPVEHVVLAIGQATHTGFLAEAELALERGRIRIDRATGQTSNPKFFAGGDAANGGREVVDAVADGKRAALGIVAWLSGGKEHAHAHA